jgi:hypothetical protein
MVGYEKEVEPAPDVEFPPSEGNEYESGIANLFPDALAAATAAAAPACAAAAAATTAAAVDDDGL